MIYADHAATTAVSQTALAAMLPYFQGEFANPSTLYASGARARHAIENARHTIATCIGAKPEQIFFTSCGTESNNWVLRCTAQPKQSRIIVTSAIEHHAVLYTCGALSRQGNTVRILPVDETGTVLRTNLSDAFSGADLVSVMFANNEIGTIEPIAELAQKAHGMGALFHTDAVQAVGHVAIDVETLGVDFLSASAHKFNGPKGIGFLYIRNPENYEPLLYGGGQESGLRSGTENVPSIVGMAAALQENCAAIEKNTQHLQALITIIKEALLATIPGAQCNGSDRRIPGTLSVSLPNVSAEAMLHYLDLHNICISSGSACNSKSTQVSHVLQAIGLPNTLSRGTLRITLGGENTAEEAQQIAQQIISGYNKLSGNKHSK